MLARAGIKPRTAAASGTITANTARTALGNISNRNALATNNQQGKEVGNNWCFLMSVFLIDCVKNLLRLFTSNAFFFFNGN